MTLADIIQVASHPLMTNALLLVVIQVLASINGRLHGQA